MLLLLALACPPEPPATPAGSAASAPTVEAEAPPAGSIGGVPILPRPVVLGALDVAAVEAAVAEGRAALEGCYLAAVAGQPALRGKVLVRFTVLADGAVAEARTRSTSLRDAPTEACLLGAVRALRLPPLEGGERAVVDYPFVFPWP